MAACGAETAACAAGSEQGGGRRRGIVEEASGRGLRGSGEAGARRHDARELDAGSMGRRQCGVAVLRMRTHESRVGDSSTGRELSGD